MSLSIGIVGMPNVGKSTIFQALTKKEVTIANYPFATIDPNVGVVEVPDDRLSKLAVLSRSAKVVPAVVEFVDIAGLVRGANTGEGLGNQFLARIREVDIVLYLIRAFEDPSVHHVEGSIDPRRDYEIIMTELALKDLETVDAHLLRVREKEKKGEKDAIPEREATEFIKDMLGRGEQIQKALASMTDETLRKSVTKKLKDLQLLSAKPGIFLMNVKAGQSLSKEAMEFFNSFNYPMLSMDAREELEKASFSKEELRELGLAPQKLPELISLAYSTANLITFFTTGEDETRAWTIKKGVLAKDAAGVIHTDFTQNFIAMQVIAWDKLLAVGGWQEARLRGLLQSEGKEYEVCDGDVIVVMHNA